MGIIVPYAQLPMGVTLSNVYISLNGEVIQFYPRHSNAYEISSCYKIYKDSTKTPDTNIRIPISVSTLSIDGKSPYDILYSELKKLYPGSQDVIEIIPTSINNYITPETPSPDPTPPTVSALPDGSTPPDEVLGDAPVAETTAE